MILSNAVQGQKIRLKKSTLEQKKNKKKFSNKNIYIRIITEQSKRIRSPQQLKTTQKKNTIYFISLYLHDRVISLCVFIEVSKEIILTHDV